MRNLLVFYTVLIISPGWAQQPKFGFVEDQSILEKLPAVREVQRILDQETAIWEKTFRDRQSSLKVYLDSITAAESSLANTREALAKAGEQTPVEETAAAPEEQDSSSVPLDSVALPSEVKEPETPAEQAGDVDTLLLRQDLLRLERKLERKKKETVAFYRKIYGENGILERRNAELSQSILERIHNSVTDICGREGTDMVFDASILLFVDQDLNLTEQVLESLGVGEQQTR